MCALRDQGSPHLLIGVFIRHFFYVSACIIRHPAYRVMAHRPQWFCHGSDMISPYSASFSSGRIDAKRTHKPRRSEETRFPETSNRAVCRYSARDYFARVVESSRALYTKSDSGGAKKASNASKKQLKRKSQRRPATIKRASSPPTMTLASPCWGSAGESHERGGRGTHGVEAWKKRKARS